MLHKKKTVLKGYRLFHLYDILEKATVTAYRLVDAREWRGLGDRVRFDYREIPKGNLHVCVIKLFCTLIVMAVTSLHASVKIHTTVHTHTKGKFYCMLLKSRE